MGLTFIRVMTYFACVMLATLSYCFGHYTNPLGGIAGLSAAMVVALLFSLRVSLEGSCLFALIIAATTVAQNTGVLPYAPLLVRSPIEQGQLPLAWQLAFGIPTFGVLVAVFLMCYYVIGRWHDRENQLAEVSAQLTQANEIISRYVASQVTQQIREGQYEAFDRHERRKLTLFFSDIKDFADTADRMEPEDLSDMLNEYLSEMTAIAEKYGATIDKFVGDAIMIFFGAPRATSDQDQALRAVRMAIQMQEHMAALRESWTSRGFEQPFRTRIGVNTDRASVGNFGSKSRLDYTAFGRQVNLAARLQAQCEPGRVLISHSTWVFVRDHIPCTPKGEIRVKGFREPVRIYEVAVWDAGSHPGPESNVQSGASRVRASRRA